MEEIWTDTAATFRLAPGAPRPHQQHMPRSATQPYCTWCPSTRAVNEISRKFTQYVVKALLVDTTYCAFKSVKTLCLNRYLNIW